LVYRGLEVVGQRVAVDDVSLDVIGRVLVAYRHAPVQRVLHRIGCGARAPEKRRSATELADNCLSTTGAHANHEQVQHDARCQKQEWNPEEQVVTQAAPRSRYWNAAIVASLVAIEHPEHHNLPLYLHHPPRIADCTHASLAFAASSLLLPRISVRWVSPQTHTILTCLAPCLIGFTSHWLMVSRIDFDGHLEPGPNRSWMASVRRRHGQVTARIAQWARMVAIACRASID
jgi:hypothetical protein